MNNGTSSTKVVKARIIEKSTYIYSKDRSLHSVYIFQVDYLTFESEDRKRIVLEVSPYVFALLLKDDEGTLTYKEEGGKLVFVGFER